MSTDGPAAAGAVFSPSVPPRPADPEDDPFDQDAAAPARDRTADLSSRILAKHQAMKAEKGTTSRQVGTAGVAAPSAPPRPDQLLALILAHAWVDERRIEELRDFFYKKGVTQVLRRNGRVTSLLAERGLLTHEQAQELELTVADMGLFPRFRITRLLGPGLAGRRYAALDLSNGSDVRVEIFRQPDAALRQSFRDQAANLERVKNRRILPVIGWGEHADACILATPLPAGDRLAFLLSERRIASEVHAARIALQTAEGLAYTHVTTGLCHGALTPSSIHVHQDGPLLGVKIADFALADHMAAASFEEAWRAPECTHGGPSRDPRADIYTIGAIFYNLLGASAGAAMTADGAIDLSPFRPLARDIIYGATASDPSQRFPDYRRLIAALARLLGELGHVEPDEVPGMPATGVAGDGTMFLRRAREPNQDLLPRRDRPATARRERHEKDDWTG